MGNNVSKLTQLLASPQLNGWGFFIGLVSLVFAFYTYFDSQSVPNLKAQIHPSRTILVSPIGAKDLTIYAEAKLIKGPVTAVQIAIWNAGSKPIKADDILEKIQIKTVNGAPIIAAHISKITREVNKVSINTTTAASGVVNVAFKILEKGDAFLLQLTYEGDDKVGFIGSGVIIGQSKFVVTEYEKSISNSKENPIQPINSKIILFFIILTSVFFTFRILPLVYKGIVETYHKFNNGNVDAAFMGLTILNVISTLILIFSIYQVYPVLKEFMADNSPFLM